LPISQRVDGNVMVAQILADARAQAHLVPRSEIAPEFGLAMPDNSSNAGPPKIVERAGADHGPARPVTSLAKPPPAKE